MPPRNIPGRSLKSLTGSSPAGHARFYQREQPVVRNHVEVAFEVGVHHPVVVRLEQRVHAPQSILGPSPRSEAVAVLGKLRLEDRFQNVPQRALHDTISHRRDAPAVAFLCCRAWVSKPAQPVVDDTFPRSSARPARLVVLVPLLSTPHCCVAVTVRYRTILHRTEADSHRPMIHYELS